MNSTAHRRRAGVRPMRITFPADLTDAPPEIRSAIEAYERCRTAHAEARAAVTAAEQDLEAATTQHRTALAEAMASGLGDQLDDTPVVEARAALETARLRAPAALEAEDLARDLLNAAVEVHGDRWIETAQSRSTEAVERAAEITDELEQLLPGITRALSVRRYATGFGRKPHWADVRLAESFRSATPGVPSIEFDAERALAELRRGITYAGELVTTMLDPEPEIVDGDEALAPDPLHPRDDDGDVAVVD